MKRVIAGEFKIDIFSDSDFQQDSADNIHQYNSVYVNEDGFQFTSAFGIKVYKGATLVNTAIIGASGGASNIYPNSLIAEPHRLVVCCADSVFCLTMPTLLLKWKTKADFATCFEVFKYKSDYIVHGEVEISRLSTDGDIIWQQSGADIFVTLDSNEAEFIITPDYILATDWENRKYKFDFDGNVIQ